MWPFTPRVISDDVATFPPAQFPFAISGCDSGFGYLTAIDLARKGYPVYAGCLTPKGVAELTALKIPSLRPCLLDVTKDADVNALVERIKREEGKLFGLLNNAGIAGTTFLELSSIDEWAFCLQVNVVGPMRMAKACIPLMRNFNQKVGARIVNISSASSFLPLSGMGAYTASKAALRNAGDALRFEIQENFNIHVSTVMPGFFRTAIVDSTEGILPRSFKASSKEIQEVYGEQFVDTYLKEISKHTGNIPEPSICKGVIVQTLLSKTPRMNVPVGWDSFLGYWFLIQWIPFFIRFWLVQFVVAGRIIPTYTKAQKKLH